MGALAALTTLVALAAVTACGSKSHTPAGGLLGCDARGLALLVTRRGDVPWSAGTYTYELTQGGITERCTAVFAEGSEPTYECTGRLQVQRLAVCTEEKYEWGGVAFPCDASVPTATVHVYRPDAADAYALTVRNERGEVILESTGPLTYQCRADSCECSLARVDLTVE